MGAGTNGLGPMFTDSSTFTDDLQRDQLSRVALSAGTATTDELDQAVSDLNDERAILEDTRDQAAAKAEQVEQAKQATEEKKAEYIEARAEAEAELGRLVQEEEERRARESYERIQAAARQAAADQAAAAAAAAQAQQRASTPPRPWRPAAAAAAAPQRRRWRPERRRRRQPRRPPAPIPAASSRAGTAVNAAMSQLGDAVPLRRLLAGRRLRLLRPHVVGVGPGRRVAAPPVAGPVRQRGPRSRSSAAQPGDLLFFYSPISHVSIYLGGGQQVHAPNSGTQRQGRRRQLGQRRRRRPTRLSPTGPAAPVRGAPDYVGGVLEGLDLQKVGPWLEANVEGAVGPFDATLIGGGRSNLTFTVIGADGRKFVLRRPPLGHVLATAHDMAREFKIIAAVGKTDVPVPPALGLCTDVDVNGAPFYVMGHVDGVVHGQPGQGRSSSTRRRGPRPAPTSSTCSPTSTTSTSTPSASATWPARAATSSAS